MRENILSAERKPCAVYITSPDYLGNILDVRAIADVCREKGVPLLVDNAHGAYLKFLPEDMHPISLGAAMCADSAHKTLPVLTGGAYLHISPDYPEYAERARDALSLFASTSPSYLTLCSLDLCNKRIMKDYPEKITALVAKSVEIKTKLAFLGYDVSDTEPLKIVIRAADSLASRLREQGIEVEYSDREYTVLMLTPENTESDFDRLLDALSRLKTEQVGVKNILSPKPHHREMSIRSAVFAPSERIFAENAAGRICAAPTVSCPPFPSSSAASV